MNTRNHRPDDTADTPAIDIVIATHNGAATIGRAVESALRNTPPGAQVIVVDDGSDPPVDRSTLPSDARLQVVRCEQRGVSAARNAGVAVASAAFVAFLDDDDEFLEGWLGGVASALDTDVGVVCVGARFVDAQGNFQHAYSPGAMGALFGNAVGLFLAGSFAVRRNLFLAAGGYDEQLRFSENTELSLRILTEIARSDRRIVNLPQMLVQITRRATADRRTEPRDRLVSVQRILNQHEEAFAANPKVKAGYCGIAGASAAQLGEYATARRWFRQAIRAQPRKPTAWLRYLVTFVPSLRTHAWERPTH